MQDAQKLGIFSEMLLLSLPKYYGSGSEAWMYVVDVRERLENALGRTTHNMVHTTLHSLEEQGLVIMKTGAPIRQSSRKGRPPTMYCRLSSKGRKWLAHLEGVRTELRRMS